MNWIKLQSGVAYFISRMTTKPTPSPNSGAPSCSRCNRAISTPVRYCPECGEVTDLDMWKAYKMLHPDQVDKEFDAFLGDIRLIDKIAGGRG